jgi:hypothetical protein
MALVIPSANFEMADAIRSLPYGTTATLAAFGGGLAGRQAKVECISCRILMSFAHQNPCDQICAEGGLISPPGTRE